MSICLYGRKKVIDTSSMKSLIQGDQFIVYSLFGKEYYVKYTLIFFYENRFSYTK